MSFPSLRAALRVNRNDSLSQWLRPGGYCSRFRSFAQTRAVHLDSYLVTPNQLHEALKAGESSAQQSIIPVCASWFMPNDPHGRQGFQTYQAERIPNARFFELDGVKDPNSPYPHMLPSASDFAKAVGALGIGNHDTVVVYDSKELGILSAPRVGWTFRAFGHARVHILNNFKLWVEQGYPTESGAAPSFTQKKYETPAEAAGAVDFEFVKSVVQGEKTAQILDARSKGRFDGTDPEPRPGLPSGHYPGAVNVAFTDLLDPQTKAFLPPEQLKEILKAKGVTDTGPIVSACGTGVTAAVVDVALAEAGYSPSVRLLYDGSWTEWAQRVTPEEGLIVKSG